MIEYIIQLTIRSVLSLRQQIRKFMTAKKPESVPPTRDAFILHCQRANYQALVWQRAHLAVQNLPSPTQYGWEIQNGELIPKLLEQKQNIDKWTTLVTCNCRGPCTTKICSCRKATLPCTVACHPSNADNCMNRD